MEQSDKLLDVLIVGAGPVGLAAANMLGRAGINAMVVEKRDRLSRHPKAAGIHGRTMEIFRNLGLADEIRAAGVTWNHIVFGWMTRLNGEELGSVSIGFETPPPPWLLPSPEAPCGCGQDVYEPIISAKARLYPSISLALGTSIVALEQLDDRVIATIRTTDGAESTLQAKYLIAADGVRSAVRTWIGAIESGEPAFGNSINIRFRADLDPFIHGRRYGLFWTINPEVQGCFMAGHLGEWGFNFEADPAIGPDGYSEQEIIRLICAAIGADIPIEIVSILNWQHDQAVTDRWRQGRVFLAGDAAHRFPPHGGFGMNSGVQDVFNLTWKLIASLQWGAGQALLDTYQTERLPIAQMNGEQCLRNTRRMQEVGFMMADPTELIGIDTPEGEPIRKRIRDAVPDQAEQFHSMGQQFGYIYDSSALIDDGTVADQSTISEYRPTAHPGARLPHVWLNDAQGKQLSTLDLFDHRFLLLTGRDGEAWLQAARLLPDMIRPVAIDEEGLTSAYPQTDFATIVGITQNGAVLVRPDHHVAARFAVAPADIATALEDALSGVLDRRQLQGVA